jgi:hypothetical protein
MISESYQAPAQQARHPYAACQAPTPFQICRGKEARVAAQAIRRLRERGQMYRECNRARAPLVSTALPQGNDI